MTEHLSIKTIERYRQNSLKGSERFFADVHLANCSKCREQIGDSEKLKSVFNAILFDFANITEQTIEHLDIEYLSDFINGKLNKVDTEIVSSHLAWCSICLIEAKEMEAFAHQLEPQNLPSLKEGKAEKFGWITFPKWVSANVKTIHRPWVFRTAQFLAVLTIMTLVSYFCFFPGWSDNFGNETAKLTPDSTSTDQSNSSGSPAVNISPPSSPIPSPSKGVNNTSSISSIDFSGVLPAEHQLLSSAFTKGVIEIPDETRKWFEQLSGKNQGTLMGGSKATDFALLSPAARVVRENRPTLRWEPLAGTVEYRVKVVDSTLGTTLPSHIVKGTDYKFDSPLEPGHSYTWQIVALNKDEEEVYGRWFNRVRSHTEFKVLATDELKLVQDAEKNYLPVKDPMSYLALAVRYAKAGLVEDAEQMLNAYLKELPASPQVVKLLNSLKSQVGK